jgi:hypothetical protein
MDIKDAIKYFEESDDFGDEFVDYLNELHEQTKVRLHLFKMVSLAKKIEDLAIQDDLNEVRFLWLELYTQKQYFKSKYEIIYRYYDKDKNFIEEENVEFHKYLNASIDKAIGSEGLDYDLISDDLKNVTDHYLEFKPGIGEKILDLFLLEGMRHEYEYLKMQAEMPENNESTIKKMKV